MASRDELDPEVSRMVRDIADEALAGFDADTTARAAMLGRTGLTLAAVVQFGAGAAIVLAVIFATTTMLNGLQEVGQTSVDPSASEVIPTTTPQPSPPASPGFSEADAVAAARAVVADGETHGVLYTASGPAGSLLQPPENYDFVLTPPEDRWVWIVTLGSGEPLGQVGAIVVLDYFTGEVYGVMDFVS